MKLSVLMITYNHENYIRQALDSVLMQETDFDFEIVIGEDCSTDTTREILCQYQRVYPEKIRLLLPEKNLGMMRNFIETYQACKGDYIAILEGDDFWTSPQKLQKQVDFLETHPDFAICFHNANTLCELVDQPSRLLCKEDQKEVSELEDLLQENFIPTLTCMFRNRLFGLFPEWAWQLKFGDWPLHVLNAQFGKIGYINETMAVYRIHASGAASSVRVDVRKRIDFIKSIIAFYTAIDGHLGRNYASTIKRLKSRQYCLLGKCYKDAGEPGIALKSYVKHLLTSPIAETVPSLLAGLQRCAIKTAKGRP